MGYRADAGANAATVALVGLELGTFVDRRFYLPPAAIAGYLLQLAVQGWCPPMPVFRRLCLHTASEFEYAGGPPIASTLGTLECVLV